uniref:CCHC-type domain-containing protein n=1 Tax=Gadus morhua TaxID=8049 RepID=A0A8C5BI65_GADMO
VLPSVPPVPPWHCPPIPQRTHHPPFFLTPSPLWTGQPPPASEDKAPNYGRPRLLLSATEHYCSRAVCTTSTCPSTSDPSCGAESSAHAAPALPPVDPTITIPLSAPQPFSGEPRTCRGFMLQCSQIFLHQARLFPTEPARVGYIISRLSGSALEWAAAVMDSQLPEANDSQLFLHRLGLMFDTGRTEDQAAQRVLTINQGTRSVAQYAVEFRTLAIRSGWGDQALRSAFYRGLQEAVKDEMVNRDWGQSLDDLIHLAIHLDARIQERRRDRRETRAPMTTFLPRPATPEPMELGRLRLSREERSRRLQRGLCMYCGSSGHQAQHCPDLQGKDSARQGTQGL